MLAAISADSALGYPPRGEEVSDSLRRSFLSLAQEREALERENRALRAEGSLASVDSSYAIVDLRARQLRFKVRGVVVRSYGLLDLVLEGDLKAWPESLRSVAGPMAITQKEDLGSPPEPRKPKPRSPLDILPPDPADPTPCYYNLCFGDALVLQVVPGDSAPVEGRTWRERISKHALKWYQVAKRRVLVFLRWEAEDRRIRITFRLPFDDAQVVFRTARVGLQAMLLM